MWEHLNPITSFVDVLLTVNGKSHNYVHWSIVGKKTIQCIQDVSILNSAARKETNEVVFANELEQTVT